MGCWCLGPKLCKSTSWSGLAHPFHVDGCVCVCVCVCVCGVCVCVGGWVWVWWSFAQHTVFSRPLRVSLCF
jgi:hypothetical protein